MIVTWRVFSDNGEEDPELYRVWPIENKGEVIGTTKNLWGTYLVVACTDGKVREVEIGKVEVVHES